MAEGRGPEELALGRSSDRDPVEVLGTGAGAGDERVDARSSHGRRSTGLAVVGGLLAVVALLWALGRPGPSESALQILPQASTSPLPPTTAGPAPTVPAVSTPEPGVVEAPVLGERSGLTLFIGGDGPLQSLDLDSGRWTRYGVIAHPVLVTGQDLVLYQERAGTVGWVPLDDLDQRALSWKRGQVAVGSGPRLLWVLDPESDEPHPAGVEVGFGRWELFDTSANRRMLRRPGDLYDEVEAYLDQSPEVGGVFDALRPGPAFTDRPDGVYRADEAGYTLLAEGRLLASDHEAVLTGWCSAEGPCDLTWVGIESGQPVDRALPGVRARVARLLAGGDWLHSVGWDGTSELVELATGRRIEHDWTTARPAVSPDGRWLAHWVGEDLVLSDLAGAGQPRPVAVIEILSRASADSLLFVRSSLAVVRPPAS